MIRKLITLGVVIISCFALLDGKTFLFIGDSITDGNWGSPNKYPCSTEERNLYDRNHLLGHGYVEMTAGYFMGEYPDSGFYFINRGISGETLGQIASRWQKDAIAHNPSVISLLCGTNDIHYWLEQNPTSIDEFDFESYRTTLDSLLEVTKSTLPDSEILLCTPFVGQAGWAGNAPDYSIRERGVDSIASITREIAAKYSNENVRLVDFNQLKKQLQHENPEMEYWIWDGIHPTTPMHYRMAKEWIRIYSDVLK